MPRTCSVCTNPHRSEVERALAEGKTFASVSRESRLGGLSPDAVERHWNNHVAPEVREVRSVEGTSPLTIAGRMSALAGQAAAIRESAIENGDARLALQAIRLEGDLLSRLTERLGVRPDAVEEAFAEAESLIRVVAHIARHSPRAGEWIADQLPAERVQLAATIRGVAQHAPRPGQAKTTVTTRA